MFLRIATRLCEERDLLCEEAPDAYKNIEDVIHELVDAGLASVIATFRPLLTYKTAGCRVSVIASLAWVPPWRTGLHEVNACL